MALAVADPGAAPVGEDQRHQDDVRARAPPPSAAAEARPRARLDRRRLAPDHARVAVARTRAGRRAGPAPSRSRIGIGADLVLERMIGGDDPRADQVRQDQLAPAPPRARPRSSGSSAAREIAAPRAGPRRAARSCWWGKVTGPPWPFAGISSDASTSGGDHVHRTRIRAGTAPEDVIIASGMFAKARTGQYPSAPYLGASRAHCSRLFGERFDPRGESLQRLRDGRVGRRRQRIGMPAAGAELLEVVGEQQGGEQQLAGLGQAAQRRGGVVGAAVDDRRRPNARCVLLAVAAGDVVAAAGDLDVDDRPSAAPPLSISRSIWPIAPSTRAAQRADGRRAAARSSLGYRRRRRGCGACEPRLDPRERPLDPGEWRPGLVRRPWPRHSMSCAPGKPRTVDG